MVRRYLVGLVTLAVLASGLGGSMAVAQKRDPDSIINYARNDPRMLAATAAARETLTDFFRHFANPAPDERNFMVKFDLNGRGDARGGAENIWATNIQMTDRRITGRLANHPIARGYQMGQVVVIDPDLIVDWGYYRGAVMQGHFSTRVQLDDMDPIAAAQLRRELGW